jgi:hypothetical protein
MEVKLNFKLKSCLKVLLGQRCKLLTFISIFLCPSLEETYYGTVLSVCPTVFPSVHILASTHTGKEDATCLQLLIRWYNYFWILQGGCSLTICANTNYTSHALEICVLFFVCLFCFLFVCLFVFIELLLAGKHFSYFTEKIKYMACLHINFSYFSADSNYHIAGMNGTSHIAFYSRECLGRRVQYQTPRLFTPELARIKKGGNIVQVFLLGKICVSFSYF